MWKQSLVTILVFGVAGAANALDFDNLTHGQIVNLATGGTIDGVTISADNFDESFDFAVGFDTRENGTRDDDLEAANGAPFWSGGNIANEELNLILIIQENDIGCGDGICNEPDDEGSRNGSMGAGNLIFDFDVAVTAFGFDVVDVENTTMENGRVQFFVDGSSTAAASVSFSDFVTMGDPLYDDSIEFGDNTANRIDPITAEALGIEAFSRVIITMGGSGGIDNLAITRVPEPSTGMLLGLAGLWIAGSRRWN